MKVGAAIFFDLHPYIVAPISATGIVLYRFWYNNWIVEDVLNSYINKIITISLSLLYCVYII